MSFTEDELQAFNTILEQSLLTHRQEIERAFDQRLQSLRHEVEQRLTTTQQEIVGMLTRQLSDQQNALHITLKQKLDAQQKHITYMVSQQTERNQEHMKEIMNQVLAAQLLCIEQLINQHSSYESPMPTDEPTPPAHIAAEVSWEGLNNVLDTRFSTLNASIQATMKDWEHYLSADVFDNVLDTRFLALNASIQATMQDWEHYLSTDVLGNVLDTRFLALNASIQTTLQNWEQYIAQRLQNLREQAQTYNENLASIPTTQELIADIEHLERMIESMQAAMTANFSLLSNRQFHHQQLPLERAHPASDAPRTTAVNGLSNPFSSPAERRDTDSESTETVYHQE